MAKSTKPTKASGFDADKYLEELEEESRKEKEAAQKKEARIMEYSIPWNMTDKEPPLPGMKLNTWRFRWEPENLEEFITKYGEECKRIIAEINAEKKRRLDTIPDVRRPGYSVTGKKLDTDEPTIQPDAQATNQPDAQASSQPEHQSAKTMEAEIPDDAVQLQSRSTGITVTPSAASEQEVKDVLPPSSPITDAPDVQNSDTDNASVPPQAEPQPTPATVEELKKSRVSARKVDADFEELARRYLQVVSLGEKKPVFLPLELRNALDTLARLSGVPNLAPSHIVINILKAFFDDNRELINHKLSGVKLSI